MAREKTRDSTPMQTSLPRLSHKAGSPVGQANVSEMMVHPGSACRTELSSLHPIFPRIKVQNRRLETWIGDGDLFQAFEHLSPIFSGWVKAMPGLWYRGTPNPFRTP